MNHCALIQAEEIQAIIGDASRNGVGGRQYCGVWSLTSKHRTFNAFGNSFAGLIPGHMRGLSPTLEIADDRTCMLTRSADAAHPWDVRAAYTVTDPYCIDHTLTFTDRADARTQGCSFREASWCCYTNCPEDPRLHFLSNGKWLRYISPKHGIGSNIAPSYIADRDLETWPPRDGLSPFHTDRFERRFDQPFYYGRLGPMVLIFVFDQPRWLRFYCSPTGGGPSLIEGQHCPAWDFEWIIPESEYRVGRPYTLRMRMIYKRYVSDDDVLTEYRRTQETLGFEPPPSPVGK